jgi:transposase
MGRLPTIPPEKKTRIVLAVLAGEMSIAEAARKEKVSEQSIGRWKAEFIEAGRTALGGGPVGAVKPGGAAGGRGRRVNPGAR